MENNRPSWSSQFAFILSAVGSAVGLGNIWRFPYLMGQNGGAIFLVVYLTLILTICFVPLMCEILLGKITQKESVGAFAQINPKFKIFGWLNSLTAVIIAAFYFVVGGWIINYIYKNLTPFKITDYGQYFSDFTQTSFLPCILTVIFLTICIFITARGVNKGIELANKVMMPIFAIILVSLAVISLNLPNAHLGLEYMFKPDFSKLNVNMFLAALGQALFTLSIGMGALLTYGSYIKDNKNIVKSAYTITFADTSFAILSGIMIFPAVFSFGLEPNSGAGLVFITLPEIFAQIPNGHVVAIAFFVLLLFAALTSGVSILEVPTASFIEQFKISRQKASFILFILVALVAIPATLSFGILKDFLICGKNFFDVLDFTSSNILLPINTLFLCLALGWFYKLDSKIFIENKFLSKIFNIAMKYIVPAILIFLFIYWLKTN